MRYNYYGGSLLLLFFLFLQLTAAAQTANRRYLKQYGLLAGNTITAGNHTVVKGSAGAGGTVAAAVKPEWALDENGGGTAAAAIAALGQLRDELNSPAPNQSLGTDLLDGRELAPGTYGGDGTPVELSANGTFYLTGGPADVYVFNLPGLQIGDRAVLDIGQVKPENIYWNIREDFTLGEDAQFSGVVLAANITLDGEYTGRLTLMAANDIALNGGNTFYALQPGPGWEAAGAFGLLAGDMIEADNPVHISGSAGAAQSIAGSFTLTGSRFNNGQGNVIDALSQVQENAELFNGLSRGAGEAVLSEAGLDAEQDLVFNGHQLTAGAYFFKQNLALQGAITLTGDAASVFIFNVAGSLTIEPGASILLEGVRPENVYWNVAQGLDIGRNAVTAGVFLVSGSAQAAGPLYGHSALLALGNISLSIYATGTGQDRFFSRKALKDKPGGSLPAAVCPLPGAPTNGSRNFIMNGSFEERDTCGTNANLIPVIPVSAASDPTPVCHWYTPNEAHGLAGSPDYYNECNPALPLNYSEPGNVLGWQAAYSLTGSGSRQGYAGINCYVDSVRSNGQPGDYREYLHQQLPAARTLKANRHYYGEFYTVLAENSGMAVARLGMLFSAAAPVTAYSKIIAPANRQPQVVNTPNFDFLSDTASWTKIAGTFQAAGGEAFVTIGNFWPRTDANGDSTAAPSGVPLTGIQPLFRRNAAYYFIDGVALYEIPYAGEAVTVCAGGSVTLGSVLGLPASLNPTYQWSSPGFSATTQQITVSPVQTTTYTLTVTIPAGQGFAQSVTASSVTVTVPAATVNPGFSVCGSQTVPMIPLSGSPAGGTWSGSGLVHNAGLGTWYFNAANIPVPAQTGTVVYPLTYTVTDPASGCTVSATVPATVHHQAVQATVSTTPAMICTGGTATATIANGIAGHTYSVCIGNSPCTTVTGQAGTFSFPLSVTQAGNYTVTITDTQLPACPDAVNFTIGLTGAQLLGAYGQVTTIDAADYPNHTVTFSGDYQVKGHLVFTNRDAATTTGTFNLTPGTRFLFDTEGGMLPPVPANPSLPGRATWTHGREILIKVSAATLSLAGAILEPTACSTRFWGGLALTDGAILLTDQAQVPNGSGGFVTRQTEINTTHFGVISYQYVNGTGFVNNTNRYYIKNTRFQHSGWAFFDVRKDGAALAGEGIQNSTFSDCVSGVLLEQYLPGDYAPAVFAGNHFSDVNTGYSGNANNLKIEANQFTQTLVAVDMVQPGSQGRCTVQGNTFTVEQYPGTQQAIDSYGVKATGRYTITGNTFNGNPANPNPNVGIWIFGDNNTLSGNIFNNLDTGVDVPNSFNNNNMVENNTFQGNVAGLAVRSNSTNHFMGNTFTDNQTGILFPATPGSSFSGLAPVIRCNTFSAPNVPNSKGIYIGPNVRVAPPGNPNVLGAAGAPVNPVAEPNGNYFTNITNPVYNANSASPLTYWVYKQSNDDLKANSPGLVGVTIQTGVVLPPGGCTTVPGVQTRLGRAGMAQGPEAPGEALGQSYPNPTAAEAAISYQLPEGCRTARIIIREVVGGREVQSVRLAANKLRGELNVNLSRLPNGIYTYSLEADDRVLATRKLSVIK